MKRLLISILIILVLLPISSSIFNTSVHGAPPPPEEFRELSTVIEHEILAEAIRYRNNTASIPFYDIKIEDLKLSEREDWAAAWLTFAHPETGEIIPTESIATFARWDGSAWDTYLPTDNGWRRALLEAPADLISDANRTALYWMGEEYPSMTHNSPVDGYLLPWKGGKTVSLSQSLAHDEYITSGNAHYSFDFYISKTMFDIHASKAGRVWLYKDDVPNGDPNNVNYFVLQDAENPQLYQLYLHLAQNSIPQSLKNVGTPVAQGQFIGIADDTGMSTGHHLHFQVETSPYWSYWGVSIDITFDDVSINGGRPRVTADLPFCRPDDICDELQSSYVSGNFEPIDPNQPVGDITYPDNDLTISNIINLTGWAFDDSGTTSARFKASYGNSWRAISDWFTSPEFDYSWDLCSDQVPDGPITLALDIQDAEGNWASNLPGLRHVIKNYTCPQPAAECIPNDDQVALFSDSDYGGSCALYAIGDHANLDPVGDNDASSILIGSNVFATLFLQDDFIGRGETFFANDSYLKDNTIGDNTVSSIKVRQNTNLPTPPIPIWPADDATFPNDTSLSLAWEDSSGASEYLLEIQGISQTWQSDFFTKLGSLSPGTYPWRVKSRNANGESDFSPIQTLIIEDNPLSPVASYTAPWSDDMEASTSDWDKGDNWDIANDNDLDHPGEFIYRYEIDDISGTYDNDLPNTGDLTSPEIMIPDDGNTYYLRFGYLYETEGPGIQWDQRWVQISVDGDPFTNLYQLMDDPTNYWLERPVISLNDYAGSTIRVRFHFETLDDVSNDSKGWYIDDFSITDTPPPSCQQSGEPNNTLEQAQDIDVNNPVNGIICPAGDIDYYKFIGSAGDHIGLTTIAQRNGSDLDTYIYLLDSNGSVLAENDDIILYKNRDSSLSLVLPSTDTYYVKIRSWNHPAAGSDDHFYTLILANDSSDPIAEFSSPSDYSYLPKGEVDLIIDTDDTGSGISHVDFYWHSSDWEFGSWEYFDSDWKDNDGWSVKFDTTQLPEQHNIAFYARVYDWAGNSIDVGTWNLRLYQHVNIIYLPTIRFMH